MKLEDLRIGMELQGTVRNVVDFGAFIDVGLHDDGLAHISKLTNKYVKHPKRIILTAGSHTANLQKIDTTQGNVTRGTYLAEKNGKVEAFRASGLNELDEGIYMADDQNNLIKIRNLEEFDALARTLLAGHNSQESRHEVVRNAVRTWFERAEEESYRSIPIR